MGEKPLNARQTRFVAEYLKDLNATQAAVRAGYSKHTAQEIGSENLSKPMIRAAVDAALAKRADKLEITAEKVLRDLEEARLAASADRAHASAIRAIELAGKHIGMFVDKVHATVDQRLVARMPEPAADADEWLSNRTTH